MAMASKVADCHALPIFTEIVYFGRAIPWIIIDAMPSMRKYKIQEDRVATPEQQWK